MSPLDPMLVDSVRSRLAHDRHPADQVAITAAVRASGLVLDRPGLRQLSQALGDELGGLGVLDPLLRDPEVTDVLVNAPDEVWLDRGDGLVRAPVAFPDEAAVRQLAVRLASRAGRRLDDATPYVDARLPGGQRLHAVIPP
jgi:pilus assembly protein CpaF